MCRERGQDWQGDPPTCAFQDGEFSEGNWNCATVNAIRGIVYEGRDPLPPGVDYQYCDDQKYATVDVSDLEGVDGALALWVTWYKCRGKTDGMWLLFENRPPRRPTEDEARAIIRQYVLPGMP